MIVTLQGMGLKLWSGNKLSKLYNIDNNALPTDIRAYEDITTKDVIKYYFVLKDDEVHILNADKTIYLHGDRIKKKNIDKTVIFTYYLHDIFGGELIFYKDNTFMFNLSHTGIFPIRYGVIGSTKKISDFDIDLPICDCYTKNKGFLSKN